MSRRAGLFGAEEDPQLQAVAQALRARGVEVLHFDPHTLEREQPVSELDGALTWNGQDTAGLVGCYVCTLPAPLPSLPPAPLLREDFFVEFMRQRERATFVGAWLLQLGARGARLVNPLQAGSALQHKPFQLDVLRRLGARVPRTLITNDPAQVRAFAAGLPEVIVKPITGGAATRLLDLEDATLEHLVAAPCIFQERIEGDDVRVTLVDGEVSSAVAIRTPAQALDYRTDPVYAAGQARYDEVALPPPVLEQCRRASAQCGLVLAGIDLKRTAEGEHVFLELNSSPIYADVERRCGHRISEAIAAALLRG